MEVTLQVEQRFGFTGDTVPTTRRRSCGRWPRGCVETAPPKPPPAGWFDPPSDAEPARRSSARRSRRRSSNRAFAHPKDVAVADDLAGGADLRAAAGRRRWRWPRGSRELAGRERRAAAAGVGRPATSRSSALHLAGKLPVVLNWTTGPANLAHAAKLMGLTHVVTSKAFIDRTQVEVPGHGVRVPRRRPRRRSASSNCCGGCSRCGCFGGAVDGAAAGARRDRPGQAGGGAVHQRQREGAEGGAADARATSSPTSAACVAVAAAHPRPTRSSASCRCSTASA